MKILRELTEGEKCWLAATLDFESSLTLRKSKPTKVYPNGGWQVYFQLSCIDFPLVKRAFDLIQHGSIYHENRSRYRLHYQDCWKLVVCSEGLRWLLPQIYPFVIAKRKQIDMILEALTILRRRSVRRNGGYYQCQFKEERLKELAEQMKRANQKGLSDEDSLD